MDALLALDPRESATIDDHFAVPTFADPWHAQAFGTALALAKANVFDWKTWVDEFSQEIRDNPQFPGETTEMAYYRQWAATLERLLHQVTGLDSKEIEETAEHWRRSYIHTPHGKPIELSRNWPAIDLMPSDAHHHHHHDHDHGKKAPIPVATDSLLLI